MVLSLFASPVINTGAVVRAQEGEPTPVPTEVMEPTPIPEEPTAVPEEPTAVPEVPTATPDEPTLEPTVEFTLEPTQTPTLMESASPTPTITTTPVATELPEVVPLFRVQENKAIPDHYIVVYKSNNLVRASAADGDTGSVMGADIASVEAMGGTIEQTYTSALTGFSAVMSPEALKKLRQNPDIDYIEQDQVVSITDDIEVNTIQNNATWGLDRIDQITGIDGKYTYYLNGTGVHAYVIDTGILASHAEFGGRAVMDYDAIDSTMSDCNGHGTHVAGTIGGTIYGVAKNVTLHGVRVLDCGGSGTSSQVVAGIDWVKAHHQNPAVVNMSLGGGYSAAENQAVASAIASGVTFVVAAGNDTADACTYSPASAPAAITVGATDLTDSPSSFSNYGACLDIFAPGTAITSSWYNGGYNTINGTSMASPHVAGAVALLLQANPSASPSAITNTLMGNAVVGKLNNVGNGSPNKMLYTKPLPNPTAPVLISPVVGASLNDTTPTFIWNTVNGASQYRIQISNTADFTTISRDQLVNEATYTDAGLPEGLFYWRVMSKNPQGIESPWSNSSSFIIDTTAPSGPLLSLPNNGASVEGTPTLEWNPVSDATGYMIEIDDSNVFSIPVVYSNPVTTDGKAITATSLKPATLAAGVTYYWHVRSRDAAGNWGAWSSTRSFSTASPVPQAPSLTSPVSGIVVNTSTPTLTWNAVEYGARYEIQISSDPTFIGADFEKLLKAPGELSHVPASGMADATKYYWRVRALNNTSAAGPWSEVRYFIIDTTGPAAPVLNLPAPESTFIGIPTFTWTAVATANAYQFQYSTDGFLTDPPAFSTPIDTPITTTSYKDLNIPIGFVYTWRVRARDAYGNWGNWSATRWVNVQASLPPAPVVTVPAIGFITNNPTPDFAWNAVTGAVSYEIQIDNQSTFASPEIVDSSATNTYTPSSSVPADGLYYYRVRAVNATGGPGAWSATRSFTLDTVAPDESALILPLNAATPVGTPTFTWKAVTGANAYQFQYSTDVTFSTIDYSSPGPGYPGTPLAVTSHKPITNMPVGIPYYWHVRARDAAGNWGEWTFSRIITIQAALPGIPVATEPAIGFMTNNTTPTFTWNAVANAATYDIQVDNLSTFISPEIAENVAASTFTPSSPLPADGIYYWRVRAVNATGGAGAWSAARSFTLDTTAPAAPTLTTPLDGATPIGTPIFIWAASAGATNYQFRYSTDNTFGSVDYETADGTGAVQPLAVTSHKPTVDMAVGTTYYWQVRARDKAGNWSVWSAIRSIRTQAALPGIPVVTAPAIGLVTNNTTPTIAWNAVTGAVSYDIQIDNLATFASPEVTGTTATTSFTPSSAITPDALYYYRVRAVNATGGAGAWSAARSFTLDTTAPAAPNLSSPLNSAISVGNPTFLWGGVIGANKYEIQLALTSDFASPISLTPGMPLTVTSYKPTSLLNTLKTYYWHVRAGDVAGNWGNWSVARTVSIVPPIPTAPVLQSPATGIFVNNSKPVFEWSNVQNAESYKIQISKVATFATTEYNTTTFNNSYQPGVSLGSDGLYYWRVQAINAIGQSSAWSAVRTLTLDTVAPAVPVLTAPVEGTILPPGVPTFSWAAAAGANAYQFQMDDFFGHVYNTPGGPAAEFTAGTPITVTSHKPDEDKMTPAVLYYWRVRARDAAGNWSEWSNYRRVVKQAPLPIAPTLSSPSDKIWTANQYPIFSWNSVANAVNYEIQVDQYANFIGLNKIDETLSSGVLSWTPASPISGDRYWRVRGINVNGLPGPWSAARKISIEFTSTFTSDAAGWAYSTSQWTLSGGYLVAPGLSTSGFISSATYNAIYSDFTYETRMRMPLSSSAPADYIDNVYGVFVQAGTSSNTVDFTSGYMFLIGQIRDPMYGDWSAYKIYKISNGLWTSMSGQYWLWLTSVNPGEWANIKTISNGSTLAFYVNGMLVKSIANAGPKFGKVGVLTWWNYDKQSVYLDYAYMSQAQAITSTSASTTSTNGTRSILDPGFYAPFGN